MNKPASSEAFKHSPRRIARHNNGIQAGLAFPIVEGENGEAVVMVPLSAFEAMEDAFDLAEANLTLVAIERGEEPVLSSEDLDAYLAAPSPLAYWRKKRGLTQAKLAALANLSQGYIAELEGGKKEGSAPAIRRLAQGLQVRMEDLMEA